MVMCRCYVKPWSKANKIAAMQLTTFPSKTACFGDNSRQNDPFCRYAKSPPDLAEAVLGLATALHKKTTLSRVFRELAVVTVGLETDAQYEVEHHWKWPRSGPGCRPG
jgi:alkylhydroperoxidase family enzyme